MSYMDATLFLPTFRSNVYYAYACPKYSFSTSHNTLYSSLLKIKYPKYSFALYISPLYLCITKPDHHIIYSTDEEVFINRILNGGAHGTVRALCGRVRDDRHIGLRPRRQDMYLLIRDVFFHNRWHHRPRTLHWNRHRIWHDPHRWHPGRVRRSVSLYVPDCW